MKVTYKGIKTGAEAIAKRRELEARTGLKLTCYSTGAGWHFTPYIHDEIISSSQDAGRVLALLPTRGMDAISFVEVAKRTGLKIQDTLAVCKYLLDMGWAQGVRVRDNKMAGIYKRIG